VIKTQVHLVRHGESTWNRDGRVQGAYRGTEEPVLTESGRAEAVRAGRSVQSLLGSPSTAPNIYLWSSDLSRALQTAEIISVTLRPVGWVASVRAESGLREQHLGVLEGQPADSLRAEAPPEGAHISQVRWGGGESMQEVYMRVGDWFAPALVDQPRHLFVISHEHTIRAALAWLRQHSWRDIDWDEPIARGSVTTCELG